MAQADVQQEHHEQIENLRSKRGAAQEMLEQLKDAREDAWEDFKAGVGNEPLMETT
jgi:membrane protein involved in colicin uptake